MLKSQSRNKAPATQRRDILSQDVEFCCCLEFRSDLFAHFRNVLLLEQVGERLDRVLLVWSLVSFGLPSLASTSASAQLFNVAETAEQSQLLGQEELTPRG